LYDIAHALLPPGMPGYQPVHPNSAATHGEIRLKEHPALRSKIERLTPIEIVSAIKTSRVDAEMEIVRRCWSQLGIELKTKYITDWAAFKAYLKSDDVQVFRYAWYADMPDPDSMLSPLFDSGSSFNYCRYHDPNVDQLLAKARRMVDPISRMDTYHLIQQRILDATPIIPLFYLSIDRVYQDGVRGVQLNPVAAELIPYHHVWLTKTAAMANPND
jgi:ABC-type transport system substrate-binding protein